MSINKLESLLEKAAKQPEYRPVFYEEVMKSDLIVMHRPDGNSELKYGMVNLAKGTKVKLKEFESGDGKRIIPIFTSAEALQEGIKTEESYLKFNA